MKQDMTCKDMAQTLIENFDASAPLHIIDSQGKFHISEMEIVKDGAGRCLVKLRLDPLNEGTQ